MGSTQKIKTIDIGKINSEEGKIGISSELADILEENGFAYLVNHGVENEVINAVERAGESFFQLPLEIKRKSAKKMSLTKYEHGFMEMDREKLVEGEGRYELKETFDVSDLDGQFPTEVEGFGGACKDFHLQLAKLSKNILACFELILDVPKGSLSSKHNMFTEKNHGGLRILHYPPIPDTVGKGAIRCGAHNDYGPFSLLFQDDLAGLEVKARNGEWLKTESIPGAIFLLTGDCLETWSKGRFLATLHQVSVPEEEAVKRCHRRSLVYFVFPDNEIMMAPLNEPTPLGALTAYEYAMGKFAIIQKY